MRGALTLPSAIVMVVALAGLAIAATGLARPAGIRPEIAAAQQAQECLEVEALVVSTQEQVPPTATRTPTPVNVGNFVWDDIDGDGRQDAGEPGLAGVTVQLWNATKTQMLDQTVTGANGQYSLTAPLPGSYRVRVLLPSTSDTFSPKDQAGGNDTLDSDINPSGPDFGFTDVITFASNVISSTTHDAGIIIFRTPTPTRTPTPVNLGNFVWDDLNANGLQDAGEPGIAGVTVQLWDATRTQLLDSKVTDANGSYTLVAPRPADYWIRVVPPPGKTFTTKYAGGDTTRDSNINPSGPDAGFTDLLVLPSNLISQTNIDAGLVPGNFTPPAPPPATATPTPPSAEPSATGSAVTEPTPCIPPEETVLPPGETEPVSTQIPTSAATTGGQDPTPAASTATATAPSATAPTGETASPSPAATSTVGSGTVTGGTGSGAVTTTPAPRPPATGTGAAEGTVHPGALLLIAGVFVVTGLGLAMIGRRRSNS